MSGREREREREGEKERWSERERESEREGEKERAADPVIIEVIIGCCDRLMVQGASSVQIATALISFS